MLFLYRLITDLAAWPLRAVLRIRAWRGKEEPLRLGERRGLSASIRPEGTLIWCHAASVGEALALLPLLDRLLERPTTSALITTGTVTSARVLAERLPPRTIHQFAPWDCQTWINRFLDRWKPDIAIRMESELWPNTLLAVKERRIPVAVVNGRLSSDSTRGWQRFPSVSQRVMSTLDIVIAQTDEHADRYKSIGAKTVRIVTNLKLAAPPLPAPAQDVSALRTMIADRPVWLAASTHKGEEEAAFRIHKKLASTFPDLLSIIAPRHPDRGPSIADIGTEAGLSVALRSKGQLVDASTAVYIADTLGDLGSLFSVSPVVFIGKSLTAHGGQNPIEPCHFKCAIIFGPHMENFQDIAKQMTSSKMAIQIFDENALSSAIQLLLTDENERAHLTNAAINILATGEESITQTAQAITDLIETSQRESGTA